jgi:CheY-like chemotaxis protein
MERAASGSPDGVSVEPGATVEPEVLHVLHVEDNAADAMLMQAYLSDVLPQVQFDSVVRLSALSPDRAQAADCALLDLSLPDASGLEALVALRALSDTLPIIVLTGYDNTELGLAAVRDGADDYLVKNDVDGPTLARTITYSIERRRRMIEMARVEVTASAPTPAPHDAGAGHDSAHVGVSEDQASVSPALPVGSGPAVPVPGSPAALPTVPAKALADPSVPAEPTRRTSADKRSPNPMPLGPDAEAAAAAVVSRRGMLRPRRWLAVASGEEADVIEDNSAEASAPAS